MSFLSTDYFPPFDRLTPELALREIPELIAETDRQITALEQHCEPTWNGLVAARTKCVRQLGYAWGLVSHLHGVCNSPAWREAVETLQPQIVMAFLRIGQSVPLYEALRTLRDTPATWDALPEGKRRVVEAQLRDARDAGVALKDDARVRFIEIQTRLSELGTRFSNNTLDAGKAFSLLLTTPEEVAGLPPNVLGLCAHAARAQGHEEATAEKGPWAVTLEIPIYQPFLKFSERRDLREKLYRARATRATAGELDNTPHLREILELRREMASLLGFPNYAELCLDSRMADTPAEVFSLIDQIGGPALTKARKELDSLQAFAAENEFTGVTVLLAPKGAMGGADCRGGAPGTRETDLLRPEKMMDKVNAVVLSGGSAYGLASMTGVTEWLAKKGCGYKSMGKLVPIVTGAVLYDLNQKEVHYPDAKMGFNACENAGKVPFVGQYGAGKGATLGKIRGMRYASKSGVGAHTVKVAGVTVTAIVAVNALGDVFDPEKGKIVAGAKANDGSFLDTERHIVSGGLMKLFMGTNTTIGCILTDAKLDKVGANKLASASHNGLARAIRPVHTDYDGDTMFCLASGHRPVVNLMLLQTAAAYAAERACVNAATNCEELTVIYDETDPATDTWQCE